MYSSSLRYCGKWGKPQEQRLVVSKIQRSCSRKRHVFEETAFKETNLKETPFKETSFKWTPFKQTAIKDIASKRQAFKEKAIKDIAFKETGLQGDRPSKRQISSRLLISFLLPFPRATLAALW